MNLKDVEGSGPNLIEYPGISLKELRKTTKDESE
jgi:hypothetical protein